MISPELVARSLYHQTCLITGRRLADGESLVSEHACPHLYRGEYSKFDSDVVWNVFRTLCNLLGEDREAWSHQIQKFMALVLRNGQIHNEEFLHRYLFEFWSDDSAVIGCRPGLDERYFKCQLSDSASRTAKTLVRSVLALRNAVPDMIASCGKNWLDIGVVEIKNERLDDRAVGQILRYYTLVRGIADREFHSSSVTPILIVPDGVPESDIHIWDAIPFYFKEVLKILFWRVTHEGRVELVDAKSVFRRKCAQRLFVNR
jgi:hypothetical protein